ncbi:hypothetical protein V1478_003010 [Vespula squamosa]|uniref:Uncharacterized protein n=1 Tax=Vespula squamosa TaxID=30214 RepID=A0ABD2BS01_VESSQ
MEDGRSERSRITGPSQHPYVHVPLFKKTSPRSHREEVAAFGDPRANADSTLQFANRDAFPLRELQASQPTGDGSHREEVAAFGDPRANADSTLQFANRDAFPLRELQASQPTGDGVKKDEKKKEEKRRSKEEEKKEKETRNVCAIVHERNRIRNVEEKKKRRGILQDTETVTRPKAHAQGPLPRAPPKGPTREKLDHSLGTGVL